MRKGNFSEYDTCCVLKTAAAVLNKIIKCFSFVTKAMAIIYWLEMIVHLQEYYVMTIYKINRS